MSFAQLEKCEEVVDKLIIDSAGNALSEITKRKMLSICSSKVKDLVTIVPALGPFDVYPLLNVGDALGH
jgi:hypothetical protein